MNYGFGIGVNNGLLLGFDWFREDGTFVLSLFILMLQIDLIRTSEPIDDFI